MRVNEMEQGEVLFTAVLDGHTVEASGATIPVHDEGFLRGDGAFEVVAVYEGRPFTLREHLERLGHSCQGLRISLPTAALTRDIDTALERMGERTYALRIIVTVNGRLLVMAEPWKSPSETIRLSLVENHTQPLLTGLKSLSYAANMLSGRIARERGYDEALWVSPEGRVLEAPTAAFFWVSADDRLLTPPLSEGILDSITRRLVLEYVPAGEQSCHRDDLASCREAFLAGTTRGIQTVSAIDDKRPSHVPGPHTKRAADIYRRLLTGALPRE